MEERTDVIFRKVKNIYTNGYEIVAFFFLILIIKNTA